MTRPTKVYIDAAALLHNLNQVRLYAPGKKIIAMVKANAYGCGLESVVPVLDGQIDAFGVASLEEALAIHALGVRSTCLLFQGVFSPDEFKIVSAYQFQSIIHHKEQLDWLLSSSLEKKIKVWVKVNTGMNRLGFLPEELYEVLRTLRTCPWIEEEIGLMTHLACSDEPGHPNNVTQLKKFKELQLNDTQLLRSISNSAAILRMPEMHEDVVRPGIMLYGISPFSNQTGQSLGLRPAMRFSSAVIAVHHLPANSFVGYGGIWQTTRNSKIGVVAAGYGDGYPRHVAQNTPVWVAGAVAPIVARISMDMLTIDITDHPQVKIGDMVELWGPHIPVETIALSAGTIAYELLCQFSPRVRQDKYI